MATCPRCQTRYDDADGRRACPADGATLLPDAVFSETEGLLPAGTPVGEYVVEHLLGTGGFGAVYRAVQPLIGKAVAIKVLNRACSSNPQVVSRFIAEARAVNQIQHRNIIDIFGFGQLPDARQYYVMELLEGQPMDAWLAERGPIPLSAALPILRPLARALDAAHAKGIAHRDLKPENVFLVRDPNADDDDARTGGPIVFPKLLDFGIAKLIAPDVREGSDHHTHTGAPIGTPAYMSPEQCKGRGVDHRTDIYSFGVMVFRMLTGRLPFTGGGFMEIAFKQMSEAPPRPSSILPMPAGLDERLLWFLEKDPERRPATLAAGVRALEDLNAPLNALDAAPLGASREMGPVNLATPAVATVASLASAPTMTGSPRAATPSFIGEAPTMGADATGPAPAPSPAATPSVLPGPAVTPSPPAAAPEPAVRKRALPWVLVGAAGVAVAAGAVLYGRGAPPAPETRAVPTPASVPATQAPPTAAPTAAPTAVASQAPTAAPAPASATVELVGAPADAEVFGPAGERLGGPRFTLPRGGTAIEIEVRAPGHKSLRTPVTPDAESRTVPVKLERLGGAPPPPRKKPGKDDIESF